MYGICVKYVMYVMNVGSVWYVCKLCVYVCTYDMFCMYVRCVCMCAMVCVCYACMRVGYGMVWYGMVWYGMYVCYVRMYM